jgi:hypothetical protein
MTELNETGGNKAKLFAKIAKVMAVVRTLPKDGKNKFDNYDYITGDSAFERVGGAMATAGIVALPSILEVTTTESPSQAGKTILRTVIHGQITLADGETGETWTSDWYGEGADRGDKSINKAMTAMMKYYLLRLFMVGSGDDADAESHDFSKDQKQATNTQRSVPTPANGHANASATPDTKKVDDVIAGWKTPADAYKWAADGGFTENEHSARTRWSEIVKQDFGNACNTANIKAVMRAYATHYFNKQAAKVAA